MVGTTPKPCILMLYEPKYLPQILKKWSKRDDMTDRLVLSLMSVEEQSRKQKKRKF